MKFLSPAHLLVSSLLLAAVAGKAQPVSGIDSTGLPGDNFSLQGALDLFKQADTPEEFEKLLNTENSAVNNLDLNGDGAIDYIKVVARMDGDAQTFILQVPVSEKENQDIAVIEVEKSGADNAIVQIIGDEDIYGEETIVEPSEETGGTSPLLSPETSVAQGPGASTPPGTMVNVWPWPIVRFVYSPSYVIWVSPWAWHHRPMWWRPWRPVRWNVFHPRSAMYHRHYVVVNTHRVVRAHRLYRPVRVTSVTVRARNQASIGRYKATRTTTTVNGRNGRKVKVTRTHVRGRRR
ncbi:MAG: hypothetical protein ABI687_09660 [Flavitalea sp.]